MIDIHLIDGQGVHIESRTISEFGAIPSNAVFVAPPSVTAPKVAQWNGSVWDVLHERPVVAATDSMERKISEIEAAIDAHLDSVAQSYRFVDRTRLALRAAYPNQWQALGVAFGTWMDTCNAMVAAGLQDVLNGTLELPTASETIAQLPVFFAP